MSEYQYYEFWVAQFPAKEKDELLVRLMAGEDAVLGGELRSRFNCSRVGSSPVPEFSGRLAVLREAHSRKPSFIRRLQDKGLGS